MLQLTHSTIGLANFKTQSSFKKNAHLTTIFKNLNNTTILAW